MAQRALHDLLTFAAPARVSRPRRSSVELGDRPPPRPSIHQELVASRLFRALSPRIAGLERVVPPTRLAPYEQFEIERSQAPGGRRPGTLAATWYQASGKARGAVLMAHPWLKWGQAYFHRRGRIDALQTSGYHALTFDLGGVGCSSAAASTFYDRDLEDALAALAGRACGLPLYFWGVSCGGYWGHALLSREAAAGATVEGAMFEDVSQHLIEWSGRMAPWGRPCYAFFRHGLRQAYRFMDLRRHAPHLRVQAAAYVSGERDRGVLPAETHELARLAGAACRIVLEADHIESIKAGGEDVIALALATFDQATRTARAA